MRNLKKILALVLALVMSLSLMATAGAGSFQDVTDDNPYKTAIDVLDQLKVFQGFEDGSFKPTDTLNRAQAAVLVYRIATGDVEGKQVDNYTYMAQSKFTDLDGYNWAKGYINYCQNAGIVVGTDATHFNPGGKVTGYQLLVMLLRTLGYGKAGEFADPKGWELQTASIAKREGILENITSGDFGAAAPRQMVAEILFRGLLKETVQYSALTPGGYTKTGETLGKKNLGLEEITGVVVANEYADLRDDDPLAADKTAMVVGDETYTLNKGTTLDDIGEARHAYIQNGSTVLYLADAGNTTEESTDAEKVDDVLSRAGITKGSADEYINFGKGFNWKSPWKIKYVLTLDETEWVTTTITDDDMVYLERVVENARDDGYSLTDISAKNGKLIGNYSLVKNANGKTYDLLYTREFAIREDIPAGDRSNIEKIFNVADKIGDNYITGEVYAGTTSKTDLSDEITLDDFIADYITDDAMDPVSKNEKGNWLKVIDNNGDGKADYILKVIYTGAQVERVKDDKITLDVKDHSLVTGTAGSGHDRLGVKDDINTLTSQKVAPMDDAALEEGDVVYYAIIDGVARAYKAEMVTATIDKINRNTKSTTTEDGTEYFESGVCNHILNTEYKDQVTDLVGKVKFDLYFDRGGWLLTFIKSNRASDFKLITDGWYNSTKSGKEYAVKVYDEEEDKQVTVDLISGGDMFVGRDVEYWDRVAGKIRTTDNNDWLALKYLGGTVESNGAETNFIGTHNTETAAALNGNTVSCTGAGPYTHTNNNVIRTTVASIDEEGNILPVEDYRITGRYDHAMIDVKDNKVPTSAYTQGTIYTTDDDTAYNKAGTTNGAELRALSTTKYYVVWPASDGVSVGGVKAFTGYSSVSSIKALASKDADYDLVEDVYAVGTETTRDNQHGNAIYYTADIVVVELNDAPVNARTMVLLVDDEGQVDKTGLRHVQIIDEDGSSKWINTKDYESSQLKAREYEKKLQPGLYYMTKVSSDPELYKLEVMTGADIRDAECFISGQVQYYRGTTRNDYVVVNPCVNSNPENGSSYTILGNDKTVEPIIDTEKSKFYELGYGFDGWTYNDDGSIDDVNYADYRKEAASLSDEDELTYRDVVEGRVEGVDGKRADKTVRTDDYYDSADGQSYFYNDVLIRTDSDNKIVWAVSFQNTYNNAGDSDFAQFVWLNTMPDAAEKTYLTVELGLPTDKSATLTYKGTSYVFTGTETKAVTIDGKTEELFTVKLPAGEVLAAAFAQEIGDYTIVEAKQTDVDNNVWTVKLVDLSQIKSLNNAPDAKAAVVLWTASKVVAYLTEVAALTEVEELKAAEPTVKAIKDSAAILGEATDEVKDAIADAEEAIDGAVTSASNAEIISELKTAYQAWYFAASDPTAAQKDALANALTKYYTALNANKLSEAEKAEVAGELAGSTALLSTGSFDTAYGNLNKTWTKISAAKAEADKFTSTAVIAAIDAKNNKTDAADSLAKKLEEVKTKYDAAKPTKDLVDEFLAVYAKWTTETDVAQRPMVIKALIEKYEEVVAAGLTDEAVAGKQPYDLLSDKTGDGEDWKKFQGACTNARYAIADAEVVLPKLTKVELALSVYMATGAKIETTKDADGGITAVEVVLPKGVTQEKLFTDTESLWGCCAGAAGFDYEGSEIDVANDKITVTGKNTEETVEIPVTYTNSTEAAYELLVQGGKSSSGNLNIALRDVSGDTWLTGFDAFTALGLNKNGVFSFSLDGTTYATNYVKFEANATGVGHDIVKYTTMGEGLTNPFAGLTDQTFTATSDKPGLSGSHTFEVVDCGGLHICYWTALIKTSAN